MKQKSVCGGKMLKHTDVQLPWETEGNATCTVVYFQRSLARNPWNTWSAFCFLFKAYLKHFPILNLIQRKSFPSRPSFVRHKMPCIGGTGQRTESVSCAWSYHGNCTECKDRDSRTRWPHSRMKSSCGYLTAALQGRWLWDVYSNFIVFNESADRLRAKVALNLKWRR